MSLGSRAWILSGRLRRRILAPDRRSMASRDRFRDDLIRTHVPGRSFADIGCLFGAHGRMSFLAEEVGASSVTAFDASPQTEQFTDEHRRRGSKVRFVRGDLHHASSMEAVGPHDVVWCTGVIYHSPNPMLALEQLRSITKELLVLGSLTVPEVPGIEQACIFYPYLEKGAREPYRRVWPADAPGLSTPFDQSEFGPYPNFWWGITPSALAAMTRAGGFNVVDTVVQHPFDTHVIARPA